MEDTWYQCWKCLIKGILRQAHEKWASVEEVSFLVYVINENEHVVNTLEQDHPIAPVLELPKKIVGYVACTDTSQ
jgi:hypothetical protein